MVKSVDNALVYWDGQEDLMIQIPTSFKKQVAGLCGTYDDNPNNDFTIAQDRVSLTVNAFVQSWKEDPDGTCDVKTEIKAPPPCYSPTNSINDGIFNARTVCDEILDGPKFKGKHTHGFVSPPRQSPTNFFLLKVVCCCGFFLRIFKSWFLFGHIVILCEAHIDVFDLSPILTTNVSHAGFS